MKFISLIALVVSIGFVTGFGQNEAIKSKDSKQEARRQQTIGLQKLHEMEELEAKSKDNIIMFNDADVYRRLVVSHNQPRPYDVVMFINLLPKSAVERELFHCIESEKQFHQVVYSFVQDRKKKREGKQRTVFFGILYVDPNDDALF